MEARKVLFLDIDTQYDFIDPAGALYVPDSQAIRITLKKLTIFAEKKGINIISSQDAHSKRDPEFRHFGTHCVRGTPGQRKIRETLLKGAIRLNYFKRYSQKYLEQALKHPQLILEKKALDLFSNPNTERILKLLSPETIYVYGLVTEYCVNKAVEGLLKRKYKICVIKDAIKEISASKAADSFVKWKQKGVKLIPASRIISSL